MSGAATSGVLPPSGSSRVGLSRPAAGVRARDGAMLHEAAVEHDEDDRAHEREQEPADGSSEDDAADDAADDRSHEADQDRQPDGHRIGSGNREAGEPADDEAADQDADDEQEHGLTIPISSALNLSPRARRRTRAASEPAGRGGSSCRRAWSGVPARRRP